MENNIVSFFDENGNLKPKEDLMNQLSEVYDKVSQEEELCCEELSYFDAITNPELAIEPEQVLGTFDFTNRSIYLTEEITPDIANSVFQIVNFWNKVDREDGTCAPIKVYINTPGGDIDAVLSIISTIKASKTPVHTITIGTGYSGGFFIGICGHKRFGLKYTSYLFHEGAAMDGGDAHKFLQKIEFYKVQLARLKSIVLDNTKITEGEYDIHRKDDWFMTVDDALRYGVIDEIIESI